MASNRVKVELIAELAKFLKPMKEAIKPVQKLQKEIAKTQAAVKANAKAEAQASKKTKQLSDRHKDLSNKARQATTNLNRLKEKYKATEQASEGLKNKLGAAARKLASANNKLRDNKTKLSEARNKMVSYGNATAAASRKVTELEHRLKRQNAEMRKASMFSGMKSSGKGMMLFGGIGVGVGLGAAYTGLNFFNEAARYEQTLALIEGQAFNDSSFDKKIFSNYIRDLAKDSKFKPAQVANLAYMIQKAGFNPTEQVSEGILSTLTDAATGTGTAVETIIQAFATYYAPLKDMMKEQGISVRDSVNMMISATQQAPIDIQDFAESMKFVATTAGSMNIGLKDSAALIAMLGKRGLKGGIATRSFTSAMIRLADLTPKAQKIIRDYNDEVFGLTGANIKFFDEDTGKFVGMTHLIKMMEKIKSQVSQEESLKFISRVFGKEAAKVFDALGKEGVEGFDKIREAMQAAADSDLIKILKDKMMQTALMSAVKTMSALQELSIQILTETSLGENFIKMNNFLQDIISNISDWVTANKGLAGWLATVAMGATALLIPIFALIFALGGLTFATLGSIESIKKLFGGIKVASKFIKSKVIAPIAAFLVKSLPIALRGAGIAVARFGMRWIPILGWAWTIYEIVSALTKIMTGKSIGEWLGTGISKLNDLTFNRDGAAIAKYDNKMADTTNKLNSIVAARNASSFSNVGTAGTSNSVMNPTNNVTINISGNQDPTVIAQKVKQELDNLQEYEGNFY